MSQYFPPRFSLHIVDVTLHYRSWSADTDYGNPAFWPIKDHLSAYLTILRPPRLSNKPELSRRVGLTKYRFYNLFAAFDVSTVMDGIYEDAFARQAAPESCALSRLWHSLLDLCRSRVFNHSASSHKTELSPWLATLALDLLISEWDVSLFLQGD